MVSFQIPASLASSRSPPSKPEPATFYTLLYPIERNLSHHYRPRPCSGHRPYPRSPYPRSPSSSIHYPAKTDPARERRRGGIFEERRKVGTQVRSLWIDKTFNRPRFLCAEGALLSSLSSVRITKSPPPTRNRRLGP